jgi:hypothetical protein
MHIESSLGTSQICPRFWPVLALAYVQTFPAAASTVKIFLVAKILH